MADGIDLFASLPVPTSVRSASHSESTQRVVVLGVVRSVDPAAARSTVSF